MTRNYYLVTVSQHIIDELIAHQASQRRPNREIVGRIIFDETGRATSYERLRNWAFRDGKFLVAGNIARNPDHNLSKGEFGAIVHSHPGLNAANTPSPFDIDGCTDQWAQRPYGIFHVETKDLNLYQMDLAGKTYRPLDVEIVNSLPRRDRTFPRYEPLPPLT